MPKLHFDPRFDKAYRKFTRRDKKRIEAIDRVMGIFASNPKHPSLHSEKLSGGNIWTIRIDRANRLFFMWGDEEDTAIFFFVGHHDAYRTVRK